MLTLLASLLASACSTSGCATIGREFPTEEVESLQVGRTTKAEVLGRFGWPYRRGLDSGDSTWTFLHYKVRLFGQHLDSRDLVVTFDGAGRVKAYTYSADVD